MAKHTYQLPWIEMNQILEPKKDRLADQIKTNKTHIYFVYVWNHSHLGIHRDWKVRGWKSLLHAGRIKGRVAIFISNKIDVKIKTVTRDKEELHNDHDPSRKKI